MVAATELRNVLFEIFRADQRDTDQSIWCQYFFGTDNRAVPDCVSEGIASEKIGLLKAALEDFGAQQQPR